MKIQNRLIASIMGTALILNAVPSQAQNTYPYPSSGSIGIGIAVPEKLLHVNGEMKVNNKIYGDVSHSFLHLNSGIGSKLSWGTGSSESFFLAGGSCTIWANGAERFRVNPNGSVGIGTTQPVGNLHVAGTTQSTELIEATQDGFASLSLKSNGKKFEWSKRGSTQNDNLELHYHDGTAYKSHPYLQVQPDGNMIVQANTNHGVFRLKSGTVNAGSVIVDFADHPDMANTSYGYIGMSNDIAWAAPVNSMCFVSTKKGSKTAKDIMMWANDAPTASNAAITIKANTGNVGIGTSDPMQYRLAVNGDAIFTKIKVKTYATWPDYVFHPSYTLRPLSDLEKYIKEHGHLPEVPSAKEVEDNGMDVADNQALLLKKIEELTLYVIEQEKQLREIKNEVEKFKAEAKKVKK
jgi:hypothetical protein